MPIQAYVDDSLEAGNALILAGYISSAERWSSFSDDWSEILSMSPRLEFFKMSSVDLKSELQMERVRHFYRVIENHVSAQVAVALNISELKEHVANKDVPEILSNPYFLAHKAIVNVTAQLQKQAGITEPIDFIFDETAEEPILLSSFRVYQSTVLAEFSDVTGKLPVFRNDRYFLPLQAADLLAWWMRKHWVAEGAISTKYVDFPWDQTKAIPSIVLDLSGEELEREMREIEARRQASNVTTTVRVSFHCDLSDPEDSETSS